MAPQDIESLLEDRPFKPFRIVVSDGTHFDISHPNLVMLGLASVTIGLPPGPDTHYYEKTRKVSLFHVVSLDPLEESEKGNGQAGS